MNKLTFKVFILSIIFLLPCIADASFVIPERHTDEICIAGYQPLPTSGNAYSGAALTNNIGSSAMVSAAQRYAIAASTDVTAIEMYCPVDLDLQTYPLTVSVWRRTDFNFLSASKVGESLANGTYEANKVKKLILTNPIAAQIGDFIGIHVANNPQFDFFITDEYLTAGEYLRNYMATATPNGDWAGPLYGTGAIPIKAYGRAPDMVVHSDTLLLGHLADHNEEKTLKNHLAPNDVYPFGFGRLDLSHSYLDDPTLCPLTQTARKFGLTYMQSSAYWEWSGYYNLNDPEPMPPTTLARFQTDVLDKKPNIVVLFTGWHDITVWSINGEDTPAVIVRAVDEMLTMAEAEGILVVLVGIPPCGYVPNTTFSVQYPPERAENSFKVNSAFRTMMLEHPNSAFVDLEKPEWGTYTRGPNSLPSWVIHPNLAQDLTQIHLSREGYELLDDEISQVLLEAATTTTTTMPQTTTTTSVGSTTTTTVSNRLCPAKKALGENNLNLKNLRYFRDSKLAQSAIGRRIIQIYYNNAGSLNATLERSSALRSFARKVLEVIAPMLGKKEK